MMPSASPGMPDIKSGEKETMFMLKVGPFSSEETFTRDAVTAWDEKGRTQISQIFISYGSVINSIAFQYLEDDKLVTSPLYGSQNLSASKFAAVMFKDASKEYVTRVSGSQANDNPTQVLKSLTIETNEGCYGPFGKIDTYDTRGFEYCFGPQNQFNGFHGLSTPKFLRSIGVYIKPITHPATSSTKTQLHIE